jgi:tRNA(Arg) A34 adenosine deaminase TadA
VDFPRVVVQCPPWVAALAPPDGVYRDDERRMALVIALARENVQRGGGPFAAAIFDSATGRLVAPGVNQVLSLRNSVLHAEIMAIMLAEARVGSFTLAGADAEHELVASCDPCAMCLGAALWSGVRRIVCAASREDALAAGFEEGPVFPQSLDYLAQRGIRLIRGFARAEGRALLEDYVRAGGRIYNG